MQVHVRPTHLSLKLTLDHGFSQSWSIESTCKSIHVGGYQLIQKATQIDMLYTSLRKSDKTTNPT